MEPPGTLEIRLAGPELFSTCQPVAGERTSKGQLGAVDRPQALPPVASLGFSLGTTIQLP